MWKNFYGFLVFGFASVWAIPTTQFNKLMVSIHNLKNDN